MKNSKLSGCWRWSAAALSLMIGSPALAATFNPTTAVELQADLNTAEANNEDDVIQIPAGTFSADDSPESSFTYNSTENHSLTIQGAGAGSTILTQEDNSGSILELYDNSGMDSANLAVSGVTIENGNSYGLALFSGTASVTVQNSDFITNYYGISINGNDPEVSLSENFFTGSNYGAYASLSNGSVVASNNIFEDNVGSGSAFNGFGSGTAFDLDQNTFQGNFSNSSAAAVYVGTSTGPIRLTRNTIVDNQCSGSAGAIYVYGDSFTAIDNLVAGNSTSNGGAGFYITSIETLALFVNNTVTDNSSSYYAGGAVIYLNNSSSTASFYNNIFFGNSAGASGDADDILIDDDDADVGSPVVFSNNVIGEFFTYCQDDAPPCVPNITETDNISEDPLFLNAAAGDFNLAAGSPAIGAGDPAAPELPSVDITGRNLNNPPDIGAFAAISGLVLSPLSINFGNTEVDIPDTQIVTLTNNGAIPVTVTALTLSDNDNYSLDASDCGGATPTLAPGESCDLGVTFDPDVNGTFNGTLTVDSNDSAQPSVVVQLSGIGVDRGNGDGGCSLGSASPVSAYAGWILIPLLWAFRRFRK
jgi:hypothetical protein